MRQNRDDNATTEGAEPTICESRSIAPDQLAVRTCDVRH